jgi:very-short-patch-repair endonuclease
MSDSDRMSPKDFARNLRRNATAAENTLWQELRKTQTGYKFRRQHGIDDRTIVDLYCPAVRLVIEVDGESHNQKQEDWDPARDKRLSQLGYLVLRFSNEEVLNHTSRVVASIVNACEGRKRRAY